MDASVNKPRSRERSGATAAEFSSNIHPVIKPTKHYDDDSGLPNAGIAPEYNVRLCSGKSDRYANGEVRHSTEKGLRDFLKDIDQREDFSVKTGMIVDESLTLPYEFGVNYRPMDEKENVLQRGGFGTVTRCQDKKTGREFASKKILRKHFNKSEAEIPEHPNVVRLLGVIVKCPTVWLLLDWAGETLDKFLRHTSLRQHEIVNLIVQGFQGLVHLKQHGIRHMDIKPGNMCIKREGSGWRLSFIDFGTAKFRQEVTPRNVAATPYYMSPELCNYKRSRRGEDNVSEKNDVYQVGLVSLCMISRKHVMEEMAKDRCIKNGQKKDVDTKNNEVIRTEYYNMICSDENAGHKAVEQFCTFEVLKPFLGKLTTFSPVKRLDSKQALKQAKEIAKQFDGEQALGIKRDLNEVKPREREQSLGIKRGLDEVKLPEREKALGIKRGLDEVKPPDKRSEECMNSKAEGGAEIEDEDVAAVKLPECLMFNDQTSFEDVPVQPLVGNRPLLTELLDD